MKHAFLKGAGILFKTLFTFLIVFVLSSTACSSADPAESNNTTANAVGDKAGNAQKATLDMPYKTEVLLENVEVPWAMDMAPDGRIFFSERPGRLRVYHEGELQAQPVITMLDTHSEGEGGLLGIALDPDFEQNHYIYVYQTYLDKGETKNRV
jgi:glucose/arabinose dehydrogenase